MIRAALTRFRSYGGFLLLFVLLLSLPVRAQSDSEILPLEPDIPEALLRYVAERCHNTDAVEAYLQNGRRGDPELSFGGGYRTYLASKIDLDQLNALDGKDIRQVFTEQYGWLFVSYSQTGKPHAFLVYYSEERAEFVSSPITPNPLHYDAQVIIDGVRSLREAHPGKRTIIAGVSGYQFFDITGERQYMVNQYTGYGGTQTAYYNKVLPVSDYIGYLQYHYSDGRDVYDDFTPMPPLKGEPVYLSDWLPYLLIGIGAIGSFVAVFISTKRKSSSEVAK